MTPEALISLYVAYTRANTIRAYCNCNPELQKVIREMLDIILDSESTLTEIMMATSTLDEALYPSSDTNINRFVSE